MDITITVGLHQAVLWLLAAVLLPLWNHVALDDEANKQQHQQQELY